MSKPCLAHTCSKCAPHMAGHCLCRWPLVLVGPHKRETPLHSMQKTSWLTGEWRRWPAPLGQCPLLRCCPALIYPLFHPRRALQLQRVASPLHASSRRHLVTSLPSSDIGVSGQGNVHPDLEPCWQAGIGASVVLQPSPLSPSSRASARGQSAARLVLVSGQLVVVVWHRRLREGHSPGWVTIRPGS